ncbi:MAG: B12-binding domain-containing radical SAM protein [Candidatus Bathyarchaeota archaeon]|nr:MAG: B12-binding domain-containing radical SAM protein [Candidatus Bathyarchaeota archaeon]
MTAENTYAPVGKQGAKIVLTASATEMSDFHRNSFLAFVGGFSKGPVPLWFPRKLLYPPVEHNRDGTAKYAPYGLRKVEAVLLENGFEESDIAVVHPFKLAAFVGPDTKVVGISTMDPLGMGYVSKTYSSLIGGGAPMNLLEFRNLMKHGSLRKHEPKIIVGGAGAWQLEHRNMMRSYGIDCVVIGEGEATVAEVFAGAAKGENIPQVVRVKARFANKEIPTIKHASVHGCVEISRGCGRNCQFCTPAMQKRRNFPVERIMKEVEINVAEGAEIITLSTEDIFLYGAKNNGFIPDKDAILRLVGRISSHPGVRAIQPSHMSLAPVLCDPIMVRELSEILIEYNCYGYRGKPVVTAETGIETGSTRLIRRHMAGKPLPFEPREWPNLVCQAFGILNDNNWYPLATLIIGLPDETEDDVNMTLQLIDDLGGYRAFFVPLLFVPLESCVLSNHLGAELNSLSKARWRLLTKCWEYNVRVWRSSFLEYRFQNSLIRYAFTKFCLPVLGFISGLYYGAKHGEIVKDSIWNMTGVT